MRKSSSPAPDSSDRHLRTRHARQPLPDMQQMRRRANEASHLLKALANEQRLRVLCLLANREMSVGEINGQLPDLSQSALSQHLAKLREEKLVQTRRDSQTILYTLAAGPVERIMAALYGIYCEADVSQKSNKNDV